jgi:hypothetical protein
MCDNLVSYWVPRGYDVREVQTERSPTANAAPG